VLLHLRVLMQVDFVDGDHALRVPRILVGVSCPQCAHGKRGKRRQMPGARGQHVERDLPALTNEHGFERERVEAAIGETHQLEQGVDCAVHGRAQQIKAALGVLTRRRQR